MKVLVIPWGNDHVARVQMEAVPRVGDWVHPEVWDQRRVGKRGDPQRVVAVLWKADGPTVLLGKADWAKHVLDRPVSEEVGQ